MTRTAEELHAYVHQLEDRLRLAVFGGDGADPESAVLLVRGALAADDEARATDLAEATEKLVNAWHKKQPEFDKAVTQVAELEKWLGPRLLGGVAAALGFAFAIAGLVMALRGAPLERSVAPVVIASLVLARALAGTAMVGFGWGLLRLSERLLTRGP